MNYVKSKSKPGFGKDSIEKNEKNVKNLKTDCFVLEAIGAYHARCGLSLKLIEEMHACDTRKSRSSAPDARREQFDRAFATSMWE